MQKTKGLKKHRDARAQRTEDTSRLKAFIEGIGVDVAGVADLKILVGLSAGLPSASADIARRFRRAVMLGAQMNKLGKKASGSTVSLFLEKAALGAVDYLERRGYPALIIHTEDEFDPVRRLGLLSLKALAKCAGLGWQGRSLLIVSPEHGPIHRWIAVLTNMDLRPGSPIPNRCGDCALCVEKCPSKALRYVPFDDHPDHREDVLDIRACKGDDGCKICLVVCPWSKPRRVGQAGKSGIDGSKGSKSGNRAASPPAGRKA